MRSSFGHMGDAFEGLREIYESLPENAEQRKMLRELAGKLAELTGEEENMVFYWPDSANGNRIH
jgi:hypothetical protein